MWRKDYEADEKCKIPKTINRGSLSEDGNYEFALNYDEVIAKFQEINSLNPQKAFVDLAEFIDLYKDKSTINSLMQNLSEFAALAKDNGEIENYLKLLSDETIKILSAQHGSENNDTLIGTGILNGIDSLYGNNGNDKLIGGSGNDYLNGGSGNDTYIFNLGDGADTIEDYAGTDTIKFGEGITKEEITFKRISNDLVLKYGADESVKINSYYSSNSYKIEKVELDNGEFITSSQIDKIIEQVNTYAKDNGITSFTNDDMRNNAAMMQIVMSDWGS